MNLLFMGLVASTAEARAREAAGGDGSAAPSAVPAEPVFMAPTPLFHVTACNCILHPATLIGGTIVLTYKWDPGRALELIEREHVTNFSGVPTMSRELLSHPDWSRRDTSSLVGMAGGGAAVQADLVGKIEKALEKGSPATGLRPHRDARHRDGQLGAASTSPSPSRAGRWCRRSTPS